MEIPGFDTSDLILGDNNIIFCAEAPFLYIHVYINICSKKEHIQME